MGDPEISIIVPAYNEEESIAELHASIAKQMDRLGRSFELIFVDDGSRDSTLMRMKDAQRSDPRVRIVTFWRNFGKANALSAGYRHARGRTIIQLDADLQDDPAEIGKFLKRLEDGSDMVVGWKKNRLDPLGKRIPSKIFNHLIMRISGVKVHDSNCGFKAYRREVMEHLDVYGEMHRYLPVIARWRGFRVSEIVVRHRRRRFGKSKYGIERLKKGLLDLVTISFISRHGRSPMHLFGTLSIIPFFLSIAQAAYIILDWALTGHELERPLAVTSVLMALWGFSILITGLMAEMLLMTVGPGRIVDSFSRVIEDTKER
ncbi:MAG: glycosyltransferase family 2 protein [Candidatus Thermoplasmatota archaeon]|nr:glycosyltransferase family 2 protein [Candidatus Thermoplasmatota archaeon]